MIHVVDVTMFHAPQSGGVKRYLDAKREWLLRQPGWRHTLVVPAAQGRAPGVRHIAGLPLPGGGGYRWPVAAAPVTRTLRCLRPDLIEAGDPFTCGRAALAAGRALGVPVLAFCHSDLERLIERSPARLAHGMMRGYLRRHYRRFDHVLAASASVEARLRGLGLDNVARQPLGVDTAVFCPQRRDPRLRVRLGLAADTRLLVYAGRFGPEKNLGIAVAALARLGAPYVLLAIGGGGRAPSGANVVTLPYCRRPAELASLLAACDAFVHPGDQETFGLAALEALACGLPVIGTTAGGIAELIDDEIGVRVAPGDAEALAAGVRALFARDLSVISARARQRAVHRHDWSAVFPALAARYRAAIARRIPSRHGDASTPIGEPG